jgi:Plus-3 domain
LPQICKKASGIDWLIDTYFFRLKFGKNERVFRLEFISNSAITPQEFEKWRMTCQECSVNFPTLEFVKSKAAEVKKALQYEYTSGEAIGAVAVRQTSSLSE